VRVCHIIGGFFYSYFDTAFIFLINSLFFMYHSLLDKNKKVGKKLHAISEALKSKNQL